ncbi:hypothetical protein [Psychroflexus tropicus]|uniref:hypothetical protein n=1 Tax=Psychroflexus tropicus TaxID=197345 RepID=UPI00036C4D56|nr:hypothetical protein [Psychroflexus tropicus]
MKASKNTKENKLGFKVPKGYFESLEASVLNEVKTDHMTKKSGFKVPKTYFSDFNVDMPVEANDVKLIPFNPWKKWVAAASIVVAAVTGAFYIDSISVEKNIQFSDLDNDMIERYLEYNLESPDEFIDYNSTSIKKNLESNISELDDEDIFEYLDDKLEEQDYNNED